MAKYPITTQEQLRAAFWRNWQHFRNIKVPGQRQNDYPAEVREAWINFVDTAQRNNIISSALADRATL